MKVLTTFDMNIDLSIPNGMRTEARRLVNLFYLGDENCNMRLKSGIIVDKYPGHANAEALREAHWSVNATRLISVKVNLLEDGTLEIAK